MKIEINIPEIALLAAAINNHAEAMKNQNGRVITTIEDTATAGGMTATENVTTSAPATPETPKAEETKETPAQKEKRELSEQIVALGGTPPKSGAVSKYREVLADLQADGGEPQEETPAEPENKEDPAPPKKDEAPAEAEKGEAKVTLETARAFGGLFMRQGDVAEQKPKFAAILKEAGCGKLTGATQEQLEKAVELLEEATGMTLAEALKAAAK